MLSRVARYLASTLLLASVVLVFGTDRDVAAQERDWVTLCDGYGAHEFDQERVAVSLQSEVLLLRAVRFCEEAVRQEPNNARLRFQLGASLVDSVSGGGLEHLEWAALRGYTAAEMMLGALALVGERPVPPGSLESETALSLALSAARKGHLDAQLLVGGLYTNAGDEDAAFPWVIKAAEQGHLGAQKAAARLCRRRRRGFRRPPAAFTARLSLAAWPGCRQRRSRISMPARMLPASSCAAPWKNRLASGIRVNCRCLSWRQRLVSHLPS